MITATGVIDGATTLYMDGKKLIKLKFKLLYQFIPNLNLCDLKLCKTMFNLAISIYFNRN